MPDPIPQTSNNPPVWYDRIPFKWMTASICLCAMIISGFLWLPRRNCENIEHNSEKEILNLKNKIEQLENSLRAKDEIIINQQEILKLRNELIIEQQRQIDTINKK